MLKDVDWAENRKYRNLTPNEPFDFYTKALTNSKQFDLLLGYFSSGAINILAFGFARFIQNHGKMRIVANNILSELDANLISNSDDAIDDNFLIDLSNFSDLESRLSKYGKHFFECLAYLIKEKRLEFVLIKPRNSNGIAHFKEGYFYDGQNAISFSGSCNFTKNALVSNLEGFTISLDWDLGPSKVQVEEQKVFFDNIFNGNYDQVRIVKAPEIEIAIRDKFGGKEISDLIIEEEELEKEMREMISRQTISSTMEYIEITKGKIGLEAKLPKFPYPTPHPYQKEAYNNWCNNDFNGLFAMATGTGKTLTALYCLIEEIKKGYNQRNIIVVPGKELVEQWYTEMLECGFNPPVKWYSENGKLNREIDFIKSQLPSHSSELNIITTYSSFSSQKFISTIGNAFSDFTLVFDEAHNMGAPGFMSAIRGLSLNRKIGLSATPLRLWDENDENLFIETFFNSAHPNYTFLYTMEEAIRNKFLCKYKYEPFFVTFTDTEWDTYLELTLEIPRAGEGETINKFAALKRQLLKDQAENKNQIVLEIVQKLVGLSSYNYTLIYCPKGIDDLTEDSYIDSLNDQISLSFPKLNIANFVSGTSDRKYLLKDFEEGIVDMLLAIKCLDEGVNIPKTMNAIFVASGQNYREFVQRRGRILRNYEKDGFKKEFANIYDIVIMPSYEQFQRNKSTATNLIISEFKRLFEFNQLAIPSQLTSNKISDCLSIYGLTEGYIKTRIEDQKL
jgi:superfamily II DNA or RNA helicase